MKVWDVVVIGAGAAGLMAGIRAGERGLSTLVLEKNRRPGVKILMSGGTRCNITHATDNRGIVEAYGDPGRFLHSALAALSVEDTIAFFENEGVPTKVEETGKVFPVSDRAVDVLDALLRRLNRSGALLCHDEALVDLQRLPEEPASSDQHRFAVVTKRRTLHARNVILTTGGQSYPGSGTTGDGYPIAQKLGHEIVPPRPALVPIQVDAGWVAALRGITLPDVLVRIQAERTLATQRGSLLFAHFGLTGPAALDISRVVSGHADPRSLYVELDLVPDRGSVELNSWLAEESTRNGKKLLAVVLAEMFPRRLSETVLQLAGMPLTRKAGGLRREERADLVTIMKCLRMPVLGTLGFGRAEVTAGGVALCDVDSRTMQSKKVAGLYLAGEILDLDGPIGGYNFQAAFSTGWLAGCKACPEIP